MIIVANVRKNRQMEDAAISRGVGSVASMEMDAG